MVEHKTLIKSFGYAWSGILYAFRNDQNFQIHIAVSLLVMIASVFFRVNAFEMGILGVMIVLVMIAEMVNTAIEHMVDLITKEHREDAKIAKDVSAGMVLLSSIGAVIVGFLVFAPHVVVFLGLKP